MVLPTICILAGGLGQRLGERTARTPKPLVDVAGEPFLFHQLRLLAQYGAERVVLCVGYLGEMIEERVGKARYGIAIDYSYDSPHLDGTLGAIRRALPLLGDRFLVLYGDTYLRLDYGAAVAGWMTSGEPALMTVLRNACGGRTRAGPCRALSATGADWLPVRVPRNGALLRDRYAVRAGGDGVVPDGEAG